MRLLVSGTTRTIARLASRWPGRLGHLLTPASGNSVVTAQQHGLPWAADNGAFSGFDPRRFRRFLRRLAGHPGCLFVVCPDVVLDARATLNLFGEWCLEVRASGQPVAFVGQDGAEDGDLPWSDLDAWFVGGSTRWKLSQASADLCQEARARGKHIHMGRVNSRRRLRAAFDMGCHSVDGSGLSRFGDRYVHQFCAWTEHLCAQPTLWR